MRPRSPLAGSIDLALDLDLAIDPVGTRSGGSHLRLLPPLPSSGSARTARCPDHHWWLVDTPLR
jgi:hypothetical protein